MKVLLTPLAVNMIYTESAVYYRETQSEVFFLSLQRKNVFSFVCISSGKVVVTDRNWNTIMLLGARSLVLVGTCS